MEKVSTTSPAPVLSYGVKGQAKIEGGIFRDGILLVTGGDAELPSLCVVCGCGGNGDMEMREFGGWNQILWVRPVSLKVFYCAQHSGRRSPTQRGLKIVAGVLCGTAIGGLLLTPLLHLGSFVSMFNIALFGAAVIAILIAIAALAQAPKGPVFERRDGDTYYFSGVHSDVLDALPAIGEMSVMIERVAFDSPRGAEALAVRMEVFVREQKVPEEVERDEYDLAAVHLVAIELGKVIGTARIVQKGNVAKIGRVAVLFEKRNCGVGRKLMEVAMVEARALGVAEMMLTAQVPVIQFYERLGFVAEGEVFEEAGIPHRTMRVKC